MAARQQKLFTAKDLERPRIKWSRDRYEFAGTLYEDDFGHFEITREDWTGEVLWWIHERNGAPTNFEPFRYLADAKIAAEAEIKTREEIA